MIPARFIVEYPARCLELLELMEPIAKQRGLLASFGLLVAATMLNIPFERMQSKSPMFRRSRDGDVEAALKRLNGSKGFSSAAFWDGQRPKEWRMSRVITDCNDTAHWKDAEGNHPMSPAASNEIESKKIGEVLRALRNALAHGNVVYLNEKGFETADTPVRYLGFLSRLKETDEEGKAAKTYRLVITTQEEFIHFVRSWAKWVVSFPPETKFSEVA